jgi:hypothetical protein
VFGPALGPTQTPIQYLPEIKRPGPEFDHYVLLVARLRIGGSSPPIRLHDVKRGNLPFYGQKVQNAGLLRPVYGGNMTCLHQSCGPPVLLLNGHRQPFPWMHEALRSPESVELYLHFLIYFCLWYLSASICPFRVQ